ncbi:MAG TPA: Crp/Fnr family transcriptional regulator [Rhizomicrobium sp.]|nr:Crp/Fnr family transcriptional regulator [Rhizomicrobium sp.]
MTAANAGTEFQASLQRIFVCPEEIAHSIARRARDRRYPVRSTIVRQGDQTVATFLLVAGRAQALTCGHDGQLMLLHEYQRGDVFGVAATDEPTIENADVVALEEVRAAVFLASDFIALLETHSCVAVLVSRALLRQLRAASLRVAERSTLSANGRVHAELLRLAHLGEGRIIRPAPVLAALAVRIHCSRETVSRAINALQRRGIIRRDGDALIIEAPHRLEELII